MVRPLFITLEGIDGTGKSTVIVDLAERLIKAGQSVRKTSEPTRAWTGEAVRRGIKERVSPDAEAFLFCADRAVHVKEITEWLVDGHHVISDRYHDSTVAYQSARTEEVSGMEISEVAFERFLAMGATFPRPDLTILLKTDPALALKRVDGRSDRSTFERETFLARVQHYYEKIVERDITRFAIIDAGVSPEEIASEAWTVLGKAMGQ